MPEQVKLAPEQWRRISDEVSERPDYEPARFLRRRTVRPKYVQRGVVDAVPIVAPLPDSLLAGSLVSPGLLAQIVVAKYCDLLPLYRQESIYWSRHQVWLPRQTMAEWIELAAEWLKPIYQQIQRGVLGWGYVQVDETPIRYLAPGHSRTFTRSKPNSETHEPVPSYAKPNEPASASPCWRDSIVLSCG